MPSFKSHRPLRSDGPVLPLKVPDTRTASRSYLTKRCFRLLVVLFVSSWALLWLYNRQNENVSSLSRDRDITEHSLPPLYEAYHDYERHLPQHNLSLPYPEGRDAKFFWASNHVTGKTGFPLRQPVYIMFVRLWVGKCHAGASHECSPRSYSKSSVSAMIAALILTERLPTSLQLCF